MPVPLAALSANRHEKAPRRTEGHGKTLKAPDTLQEYAAISVVTTIQATGLSQFPIHSLPLPGVSIAPIKPTAWTDQCKTQPLAALAQKGLHK